MNEIGDLKNRVALVTGSSSGIGAAIAKRLAQLGARVILHGRSDSQHLKESAQAVARFGADTKTTVADFSDTNSIEPFIQSAWNQFGHIDIVVNNAGGDVLTGESTDWSFEEKLQYLLKTDVTATLMLSRRFGRQMIDHIQNNDVQSPASIINIGWDQAYKGMAGDSGEMFATTKGAIMSMTLSLAQSLAPSVRVNCVAPGWIKTDWGNQASSDWDQRAISESLMNRWGQPEDVANMVSFLASSQASFVSGQIINVNGGFRIFRDENEQ